MIKEANNTITLLENEKNKLDRVLNEYQQVMLIKNEKLEKVKHLGVCHECKQTLGANEAANQEKQLLVELQELFNRYDTESKILSEINVELSKISINNHIKLSIRMLCKHTSMRRYWVF